MYAKKFHEFFENNIESQQNAARKLAKGFDKYNEYLLNLKEKEKEIEIFNAEESEQVTEVEKPFDSVFIAASGQALTILASQLQYNYVNPKQIQFFGTPSWEDESILNEPALEGGLFTATSQVYQKTISKIYKKSFKKNMPKVAMIAYDILALLGTLDFEKDNFFEVKNLINEEGYLGLRGLFRLTENGLVERTFDVKQIKNNRFIIHEAAKNNF